MKTTDRAIEAFKIICDNQVSGIAIVDSNGKLVGNISASDLRVIFFILFVSFFFFDFFLFLVQQQVGYDGKLMSKLLLSVQDFAKLIPKNTDFPGPYCVRKTATVYDVVEIIRESRTHRVYVVDDEKHPIGVISLIDIIDLMLRSVDQ